MKMIYIVIKRGAYRHEVVGNHVLLPIAVKMAQDALDKERDDYHTMEIIGVAENSDAEETRVAAVRRDGNAVILSTVNEHGAALTEQRLR